MKFLFDTDHVSILQSQHRPEYDAIIAQMAKHPAKDLGFSLISFHEQVLGAHTYITGHVTPLASSMAISCSKTCCLPLAGFR